MASRFGFEAGDYAIADWDGYGAQAISKETFSLAEKVFDSLPPELGPADISPGNDGSIGFEWRVCPLVKALYIEVEPSYCRPAKGPPFKKRASGTIESNIKEQLKALIT